MANMKPRVLPTIPGESAVDIRKRVQDPKNFKRPGVICPTCDQIYCEHPRRITELMAVCLLYLYWYNTQHPKQWVHLSTGVSMILPKLGGPAGGGDPAKLAYPNWELVQLNGGANSKTGLYRITKAGRAFVNAGTWVPEYIFMLNKKQTLVSNELVNFWECLGKYDEAKLLAAFAAGKPVPESTVLDPNAQAKKQFGSYFLGFD